MLGKSNQRVDQCQIDDQNKEKVEDICIKNLQTKFLTYVDSINSSINAIQNQKRRNRSTAASCHSMDHYQFYFSTLFESFSMVSFVDFQKPKKERKRRSSSPFRLIQGDMVLGKVHGKATLKLNNGSIFNGIVDYGQIKQGNLTYPNGAVYYGTFNNWLPHGSGSLVFPDGTQYRTVFKHGETGEKALIIYPNGDIYKGPIYRLKKHGVGKLIMKNGDKYVGDFQLGQITGEGTYYRNTKPPMSGIWKNGELIQRRRCSVDVGITMRQE